MKIYKTSDNIYLGNEEEAITRCNFINRTILSHDKEMEETYGKIVVNNSFKRYATYEEIDLDNPETVAELFNDYINLKKEIEYIKEWIHLDEEIE